MALSMWADVLDRSGFSGIDIEVRDCEDDSKYAMSVIMSSALPATPAEYPEEVVLMYSAFHPPSQQWLTSLRDSIKERTGVTPTIGSAEKLNPVGKVVVFVSEMEAAVLDNLDAIGFERIKTLLNESKGVMWLTRGATVECDHPERALHTGLLRTRRLEDSVKRYIALDLDPQDQSWSNSSIHFIVDAFATAFNYATEMTTLDFELAVRDGDVLIPRVSDDLEENEEISIDFGGAGGSDTVR